jgi:hypothetical protein
MLVRRRPLLLQALLLFASLAPLSAHAAASAPDTLADSTVVQHWTLDNGLRVVTRHVPEARAVAITVAYASGTDDDPAGRDGLAQLLGHLAFTGPAGDIPERTRDDLDSQRPFGWSFPVSRRTTLLTEVASVEQFPGVLSQIAGRMRGVRVTPAGLQASLKEVQGELDQQLYGPPQVSLYHQVREVALERKNEEILRRASGRELGRLSVAEVQQQLAKAFVPSNAILALAGNLSTVDVQSMVRNLFGGIPGGTPRPAVARGTLKPMSRTLRLARMQEPAAVVGVIAPALSDSLHPSFYVNALLMGSHFTQIWQARGTPGERSTHHYALFDEPDLMRVFPPVDSSVTETAEVAKRMNQALNALQTLIVTTESYDELRTGALWLLGGPMRPTIRDRARREPMLLHSLARSMASRGLWGGEVFWSEYRHRFASLPPGGLGMWMEYFKDPQHQVVLLALPGTEPRSSR